MDSTIPRAERSDYLTTLLNRLLFLRMPAPRLLPANSRLHPVDLALLALAREAGPDSLSLGAALSVLSDPRWGAAAVPNQLVVELLDLADRRQAELTPSLLGVLCERDDSRKPLGAFFTDGDAASFICSRVIAGRMFDLVGARGPLQAAVTRAGLEAAAFLERSAALERGYERHDTERRALRLRAACGSGRLATFADALSWNLDPAQVFALWLEQAEDSHLLEDLGERLLPALAVLDPTCGSGAFLEAALHFLARIYAGLFQRRRELAGEPPPPDQTGWEQAYMAALGNLNGTDLMPASAEAARLRLTLAALNAGGPGVLRAASGLAKRIVAGNALLPTGSGRRYEVIVGNPPYGPAARTPDLEGLETRGCANRYAWFVERSLQLLASGGRLGLIVPISVVAGEGCRPLRGMLERHDLWISTYANRPAKLFDSVEQRLAILLTAPSRAPVTRMSPYLHWYVGERPGLFRRVRYVPASRWAVTGVPVKSGTPEAEALFTTLHRHSGRLEAFSAPGEAAVWLHDAPTYWVRALPFSPGRDGGRPPGHYRVIPAADQDAAHVLAAVLSSSTFYSFYKMVSNCRDLGTAEWKAFPIDPLPEGLRSRLAGLGARLAARLKAAAARRSRVYPSGEVGYLEYYPGKCWELLREIDHALAEHYGFSEDELEYVLNHDRRYRMGKGRGA